MNAARPLEQTGWTELAALAIGLALALILLARAYGGSRTDFEQLSPETTPQVFATVDGQPIHCKTVVDADRCVAAFAERGSRRAALWLGNSQLHSINQWKPGEPTATLLLHQRLRPSGLDLVTFSQPNANLQEHLVLYLYLFGLLPLEVLLLPLVFDDLRENGIRADVAEALHQRRVSDRLSGHEVGRRILANQSRVGSGDLAALDQTVQEHVESLLTGWLEEHSGLWALRTEARGQMWKKVHDFRNLALGITPTTERRLIPGHYQANMAALRALLEETRRDGVRTWLYIVPLRSDVKPPYEPQAYAAFKAEVEQIARETGVPFASFESAVPVDYWGVMHRQDLLDGVQLDFMHFQSPGHELFAKALGDWIEALEAP